jgi:hypothetical protein
MHDFFQKSRKRMRLQDAIWKVRLMASLDCLYFNTLTVPEKWKDVRKSRHGVDGAQMGLARR